MILAGPRALPCYVRVLAWPDQHMPAAARLRFSRLQAMPHQSMKCIIQAAATSCWPRTVTPAEKPPCRKAQTVSQTKTSTLDDHAAVNARPTGRGSEPNQIGLRSRRSQRLMAGLPTGLRRVALRPRRAALLTARAGRAGGAGRLALKASEAIAVTRSRAGSTNAETLAATAAAAMGCPAATVAAMTAAALTQPAAVTAATAISSGAAAGLTSQDASLWGPARAPEGAVATAWG